MPQYMLLIRGDDEATNSPEETERVVQQYIAWARSLRVRGKMLGGDELAPKGRILRGSGQDLLVTDGPFAESKEQIGGYFLIQADGEEEAVAIAGECPGLRRGRAIELREIVDHS